MIYLSRQAFTEKYAPAIANLCKGTGIYPQTLLAMAIVESQGKAPNGNYYVGLSPLAAKYKNYFGIKKGVGWKGKTIALDTPNDADPVSIFRVYNSFEDSAADFIKFLKTNKRYEKAGVFKAPSYPEQIMRIAKAGYSESSSYTEVITAVAKKINGYIDKIIKPYKKTIQGGGPVVIALLILTAFAVNKLRTTNKKAHE